MPLSKRKIHAIRISLPIAILVVVFIAGSVPQGPFVITPPPNHAESGRWIHIEGAANTRDAGGYATLGGRSVEKGMVFRSGKLNRLSPTGVEAYHELGELSL